MKPRRDYETRCPPVPWGMDHCPECGEWDLVGSEHRQEEVDPSWLDGYPDLAAWARALEESLKAG